MGYHPPRPCDCLCRQPLLTSAFALQSYGRICNPATDSESSSIISSPVFLCGGVFFFPPTPVSPYRKSAYSIASTTLHVIDQTRGSACDGSNTCVANVLVVTPSPPTKSSGFRGFDSSKLLILKGGNSHVRGLL